MVPRGDGTGPMGMGPMTGKGAGFCAGFTVPGCMNAGMGFGRGFGRGLGFRRMSYFTPGWVHSGYPASSGAFTSVVDEKAYLNKQVEVMESHVQEMKNRLKMLNNETEE
jgi:hypothetical protein